MKNAMFQYDKNFYEYIERINADEKIIIPFLIKKLSPTSVIDFGCGEGLWLKEVMSYDKKIKILGVDGDYVQKDQLKIPVENFFAADLRSPIVFGKKFDLAISTEVAEHIEQEYDEIYLDNITKASDQILFSAAVPGQMGVNHINEQWQSYWIKKFKERGYHCDYSIREYFWNDERINSWRRQNILFFSRRQTKLAIAEPVMDVIHPEERERVQIESKKYIEKQLEVQFEERMNYIVLHPEIIITLDQILKKIILLGKKLVIYPYGGNGQICERLLSIKYHIKDYIVADNNVTIEGKQILRAADLKQMAQVEEISVIDTCSNPCVHKEVLDEIHKYVDSRNIYSAFEIMETGTEQK